MATVTVATLGTWGDLFPLIGLGVELTSRGHEVRLAASPAWRDVVPPVLEFVGIGQHVGFDDFAAHPELFRRMPFGLRAALRHFMFAQIGELTRDLRPAMEGAGLVIAHPVHVAALNLAEQLGLRRAVASVFPGMIPSAYTVPGGSPVGPWRGPIGRTLNRLSWGTAMLGTRALFDRPVNAHRRQLGLAPLRAALLRLPLSADAVLVMAPPAVVVVPPDCPAHVTMTSFIGWDDVGGAELDAATEAFLEGADPPVLVTLGASSATQPDDFFVRAVSAVTAAGGRALVAAGPAYARLEGIDDDRVRVVPFVPFSQAASRCQAAIHHGGIGTTVAIARAGIPQIIVPKGFDQPDTAARFAALGVAAVVPWRSRHRLRTVVPAALADEQLRANAVRLSEAIGVDGARETAEVVEALLP